MCGTVGGVACILTGSAVRGGHTGCHMFPRGQTVKTGVTVKRSCVPCVTCVSAAEFAGRSGAVRLDGACHLGTAY